MSKWEIVSKSADTKTGYTLVRDVETGKERKLRNPSQKGARYAEELAQDVNIETGKFLTEKQRLYRLAYLASQRDSADAYNANKAKSDSVFAAEWAEKKKARKERADNAKVLAAFRDAEEFLAENDPDGSIDRKRREVAEKVSKKSKARI
jgi:hypothetical protein